MVYKNDMWRISNVALNAYIFYKAQINKITQYRLFTCLDHNTGKYNTIVL